MKTYLESGRFYLRELVESDWQAIHDYASQEIVSRYQPWGPNAEEDTQKFVNDGLMDAKKDPRTRYMFPIVSKTTEKLIGAAEFNIRDQANQSGEIGYIINPAFWGQGIATEAASWLIGFGFNELGLHRIYATCNPQNAASQKVLEKSGVVKEGLMREDLLMKDGWRDSLLYSILEHEWRKSKEL
ncbi:GNAT family N-acetyltransferase [Planomicrobium sp. CPCC 101079]|uniref:GNAT family N-acetyltransferase n=1 Tax=Planomicrobium sp. CPCC 101079 TaxID=2599618 RepID=UPI0011B7EF68|nr:GNAT family protein [Planomicrobium sp. CPCC 101079]TWT13241.1 GNAT family N-acetyltransferase [Planomicrobium sp. CPCC 101079]